VEKCAANVDSINFSVYGNLSQKIFIISSYFVKVEFNSHLYVEQ